MTKNITLRQVLYTYILMILSPIIRHLPNYITKTSGAGGYVSILFGTLFSLIIIFSVRYLVKAFPAMNLYEILESAVTVIGAKIIIALYALWALFNITAKIQFYAITCQTTLISHSKATLLFSVILLIVAYCLYKGIKSAFRLSELLLVMFVVIIGLLAAICFRDFDYLNLLPLTLEGSVKSIRAVPATINVVGFIFIVLFFSDCFDKKYTSIKPYMRAGLCVAAISFVITLVSIGINGAQLTSKLTFPFYAVVRRSAFFNILERLEAFVVIPSIVSDFVYICVFSAIFLLCIKWLFGLYDTKFLIVPVLVLIYFFSLVSLKTQFESDMFYYNVLIYLNTVFLYVFPIVVSLIVFVKNKITKSKKEASA